MKNVPVSNKRFSNRNIILVCIGIIWGLATIVGGYDYAVVRGRLVKADERRKAEVAVLESALGECKTKPVPENVCPEVEICEMWAPPTDFSECGDGPLCPPSNIKTDADYEKWLQSLNWTDL